ncbi:S1 RNA-binding domain-containing protein, partial [bacterium]|nr:S1 RNA-binding domain-containing protein [bacterium]
DPWIEAADKIKEGDKVEGVVTRLKHFGAFIEVFPGVEALLPHNEVTDFQNESKTMIKVGDKISTYVLKFNPADKRIALSVHEQSEALAEAPTEE